MNEIKAVAEMLIHKASKDVFDAFANPDVIIKFWLKETTGPLAMDAVVDWDFMVPGSRVTVTVTDFSENSHIAFQWSNGVNVDMLFREMGDGTRVTVKCDGFEGDDAIEQSINTTEGFAIVLCDLKSLLETGKSGNMVRDKAVIIAS